MLHAWQVCAFPLASGMGSCTSDTGSFESNVPRRPRMSWIAEGFFMLRPSQGMITLSMTWMTPLLPAISVAVTLAPSTMT